MAERHTMQWLYKEHFITDITDRRPGEKWEADGRKSVVDRAKEKVRNILKEHQVNPVPKEVAREFDSIVKRADKDIRSHGLS